MKVRINIEPVAKGRPKVRMLNGKVWTFTPKKTEDAQDTIRVLLSRIEPYPAGVPLKMVATFYRSKPRWLKRKEDKPFRKPDAINLASLLCDALSKVAYDDDAQLTTIVIKKRWTKASQALGRKAVRTPECSGYIKCEITEDNGI